jgi:hypothetical protein
MLGLENSANGGTDDSPLLVSNVVQAAFLAPEQTSIPPVAAAAPRSRKRKPSPNDDQQQQQPQQPPPPPPQPQVHPLPVPVQLLPQYAYPPPDYTPGGIPPPGGPPGPPPPPDQKAVTGPGGRQLSTSKRAEQNRKAQRAFRERRDQSVIQHKTQSISR